MTTIIDVIDTSVKIGLGSIIGGMTSFILYRQKNISEARGSFLDEKRSLIKELAIGLEDMESQINQVVVHLHNDDFTSAKDSMIPVGNQIYKARAYANILSEENMVKTLGEMAELTSEFYIFIVGGVPDKSYIDDKIINKLVKLKLEMYPAIQRLYKNA